MLQIRRLYTEDTPKVKTLADKNRRELGFNPRQKFEEVASEQRGFVAVYNGDLVGFVIFRHRKIDLQTTLSEICVQADYRHHHIGEALVAQLIKECTEISREYIQLKCPVDLTANRFYARLGFVLYTTESGKRRSLNVWRLAIPPKSVNEA
ncbi:MAG: hypothetical protein OHK0046_17270 [Anaerolineae bacterium]